MKVNPECSKCPTYNGVGSYSIKIRELKESEEILGGVLIG